MTTDNRPEPPPVRSPEDFGGAPARERVSFTPRPTPTNLTPLSRLDDAPNVELLKEIKFDGGGEGGGVALASYAHALELSKFIARMGTTVPAHCRNDVGVCLGIVMQAAEWRQSPIAVAKKSYLVNDVIGYESQLLHAVVERLANLEGRLRDTWEGEGDERRCIITGKFKGEQDPHVLRSETLAKLRPPVGERGRKGSPLWDKDPDQQQFYYTVRSWARRYCPDVLLGVYSPDELETIDAARTIDVTATSSTSVIERLSKLNDQPGLNASNIDKTLDEVALEANKQAESIARGGPKATPAFTAPKAEVEGEKVEAAIKNPPADGAGKSIERETPTTIDNPGGLDVDKTKPIEPKPDPALAYCEDAKARIAESTNADELSRWWKDESKGRKKAKLTAAMSQDLLSTYTRKCAQLEGMVRS